MSSIAARAHAALAQAACIAACLVLAGCALPLPDKPVRPQPYDLGPPLPLAADVAGGVPLTLAQVESSAALDGTAVVYRLLHEGTGQQPRPYATARWSMSPPQLVAQRLRQALSATRPVVDAGAGLAATELRVEIDDFSHSFSSPQASEGVVRLRATLVAPTAATQRLLGQRSFEVRRPAPSADPAGGVGALRAATDEALRQLVEWVTATAPPR